MAFRRLCRTYSHSWVFLYWLLYLPWFSWLEQAVTSHYFILESGLDPYIPFCEGFILPYLLWFPYVGLTIAWFFFHDRREFYQLTIFLYLGMTLFLIISTVFPNGLALRPDVLPRNNFFTHMVQALWAVDTPTNVLPSLHVYNSVVCCAAISRCQTLRHLRGLFPTVVVLTVSIVLSTLFLKQHSIIDVLAALLVAQLFYPLVYHTVPHRAHQPLHNGI